MLPPPRPLRSYSRLVRLEHLYPRGTVRPPPSLLFSLPFNLV
jgi:hypothetical protein